MACFADEPRSAHLGSAYANCLYHRNMVTLEKQSIDLGAYLKNPLEARTEAVESIIHSLKDEKPNLKHAQEELEQKFGIQLEWRQHLQDGDSKRLRRRQSYQKRVISQETEHTKLTTDGKSAQNQSSSRSKDSRTTTLTQSKQFILQEEENSQENGASQGAQKPTRLRELIVHEASSNTEEKSPPLQNANRDNDDESVSTGNSDQEMINLLENLDEADEGESNTSSERDEAFCKVPHPISSTLKMAPSCNLTDSTDENGDES
ncbi:unnamed protein product [Peronospora belbahrii]|uniref:Uncharacterized protein n=1 Tax=Peronospora belbahrii TaxID=622444 RepID=A0ABN8D5C2_9STRA|nr:unnamed protein product [Peronospora belbahrii]